MAKAFRKVGNQYGCKNFLNVADELEKTAKDRIAAEAKSKAR
jgi:hypothetical protein